MLRTMMKSKIHRATVTQADLHYVGSVTVDEDLLEAADLLPGELVHIVDVTNGARIETYTIAGERGSGVLGINGAAARLVHPGDVVILIAYGQMDDRRGEGLRAERRLRRRRQPDRRHRLGPRRGPARQRPRPRRPAQLRPQRPRRAVKPPGVRRSAARAVVSDPRKGWRIPVDPAPGPQLASICADLAPLTDSIACADELLGARPTLRRRARLDHRRGRRRGRLRHRRAHRGTAAAPPGGQGPRGHQGRALRGLHAVGAGRHRGGARTR